MDQKLLRAKEYQRIKNWVTLAGLLITLGLLIGIIAFHIDSFLFHIIAHVFHIQNRWLQLLSYFFLFSTIFFICEFPLGFYSGYAVEKKYELSNHTLGSWLIDLLKREILSFVFMGGLLMALYALIWQFPENWWIWAWAVYTIVSLVIGQLFPVFIIPIFYKQTPIAEGELRNRIMDLGNRFQLKIENIYTLNLSRTTKKANAMFCGMGKTKRAILGDTLVENFNHDEIEMVLAHELGHYKHQDIWKQFFFGVVTSFVIFWGAFHILKTCIPSFGHNGAEDISAFPFLTFIFFIASLLLGPLGNAYSRYVEMKADEFALRAIPTKNVFISSMNKLSSMNLADPSPHPVIEFLLYSHPSIQKRIQFAEGLAL